MLGDMKMWWYRVWVLQIITESLPISSSSHVAIASMLAPTLFSGELFCTPEQFEFLMHIPTILVLLAYFFGTWWRMIFQQNFSWPDALSVQTWNVKKLQPIVSFFFLAESLTVVFWLLKKIIAEQGHVLFATHELMITGLLLTGFLLVRSNSMSEADVDFWSPKNAWFLGCAQGLALLPGISRMGITLVVCLWLGYRRRDILALSTLLCMPLLVASGVKALFGLSKPAIDQLITWPCLGLTCAAMVMAYVGLMLVDYCVRHKKLYLFGLYLMLLGVALRVHMMIG